MVDLDTLYHLPYDGVIIGILILSPFVDDVLDFLEPCLEIAILTLALTDCSNAFGKLLDLCGYVLEVILMVFRIVTLLDTQGYQVKHSLVQGVDPAFQQVDFIGAAVDPDGFSNIPSDFRTSRGLIFVLAKYGFQPSGVPEPDFLKSVFGTAS